MRVAGICGVVVAAAVATFGAAAVCPGVPEAPYTFKLASGWKAARVASGLLKPRDLVVDSEGRLLIVESGKGISQHTMASNGCIASSKVLIPKTDLNHGIYLSPRNNTLYASSATTVYSWPYTPASGAVGQMSTVVTGMASGGHVTRTLIIPPNKPNLLVVSHGSNGNIDAETINPKVGRALIKVFDLDNVPSGGYNFVTNGYLAGFGLRNTVGLAFDVLNRLWGVENSADDLQRTANGKSYSIVKDNPAEELNFIGDVSAPINTWYGYPRCFTVGQPSAFTDTAFRVNSQFVPAPNSNLNDSSCRGKSTAPSLTLPAHTAPLGLKFDKINFNLYVSLHGSWDRNPPQGYKIIRIPLVYKFGGYPQPIADKTNATGFADIFYPPNEAACTATTCARPVGLVFDRYNRLYMTSDTTGELFMLKDYS